MKCVLLSLALLGATPASGCWLRNSVDGTRTDLDGGWNWGGMRPKEFEEALVEVDEAAKTAREKRIAGKRALAVACSDNKHFSECSQDRGSAIRLERCLKARSNKISASCRRGLQAWKELLVETAPDARNLQRKSKKAQKALAARAAHVQEAERQAIGADAPELSEELLTFLSADPEEEMDQLSRSDPEGEIDLFLHPHPPHHEGPGGPPHHHSHKTGFHHRGMGPHHNGMGPHQHGMGPHQHGMGPHHHGMGPHHIAHAPAGFFEEDELVLGEEERRPSMFSVLADWIFGDSSSSDSLDSSDSWDSSSSSDDFVGEDFTSVSSSTVAVGPQIVDAGFFPAGYGSPFYHHKDAWEVPRNRLNAAKLGNSLRGSNNDPVFYLESIRNDIADANPVFFPGEDPVVFFAAEEGSNEVDSFFAGYEAEFLGAVADEEIEAAMPVLVGQIRGEAVRRQRPRGARFAAPSSEVHEVVPGWDSMQEEDFPMFAGGPHVHPKRHHRGDHIRFRNPLPEDFENQRAWLSDSFDVDGDGPDLVEAILAFFFFIGAITLMLLPFFLLGRALKRMVRNGGSGSGGDTEAPDGYYALPDDAAPAGMVSAADDDDSIVVTGTPPPSENRNDEGRVKGGASLLRPKSSGAGDGFAEDMDPFMALLRTRQHGQYSPLKADDAVEGQESRRKLAMVMAGASPEVEERVAVSSGEAVDTELVATADTLPPSPHHHTTKGSGTLTDSPEDITPTLTTTAAPDKVFCAIGRARGPPHHGEQLGNGRSNDGGGGEHDILRHAHYTARRPDKQQPGPTPCYARGTSAGAGGVCRRKSRGKDGGVPKSFGHAADSLLRLCPALEARISDLRRDNTAAAHFLDKAQAAAWHKARRPVGELVSRNRAVCALEGAELSMMRREEMATRARCRREANRERKKRLERRRQKEAEATRIKHEGPSLAEVKAIEQAALLEKRQRLFLRVVVLISSATWWRNDWKERKWKLEKFAEALATVEEKALEEAFEASVLRIQRFFRRRQGAGLADVAGSVRKPTAIGCLKRWIPSAHNRWKRRRQEAGIIIYDFLKDARLSHNLKAIYRFRRKVMWCQSYVRGVNVVTRDRLVLLDLFFRRCEVRLRGRLAERVRQQVLEEAAADLAVHQQLMRPSSGAAGTAAAVTADIFSAAAAATAGGRSGRKKRPGGGRGSGDGDDEKAVGELMETVAALRLKSALEELETRSARPDVKLRLLEGLLVKVRATHQANVQLLSAGNGPNNDGRSRNRPGISLPDALFTVDDARELLTRSPPPPQLPGPTTEAEMSDNAADDGGEMRGALSLTRTMLGDGRKSHTSSKSGSGSESKPDLRTHTRVPPMLLLKGVPEAVMCQLVLAGWEQSPCVGVEEARGINGTD
eukprot:g11561.t1